MWRFGETQELVEVVVEPAYRGSLLDAAQRCPVWIVDTPDNAPLIDAAWRLGETRDYFEISRIRVNEPGDRWANFLEILGMLDDHRMGKLTLAVRGLRADAFDGQDLGALGLHVVSVEADGSVRLDRIESERNRLIGRVSGR